VCSLFFVRGLVHSKRSFCCLGSQELGLDRVNVRLTLPNAGQIAAFYAVPLEEGGIWF
jgi:hypothetical protein